LREIFDLHDAAGPQFGESVPNWHQRWDDRVEVDTTPLMVVAADFHQDHRPV
jgi:hypothetical protein